jgi:pimeloyl-ACP methyl ester carboxylesterase
VKLLAALTTGACLSLAACTYNGPRNPALTTDAVAFERELDLVRARLRENPVALPRPVVIVSGYLDPGIASQGIAKALAQLTTGDRADFLVFNPRNPESVQEAAVELGEFISRELTGSAGAIETPEVDVVGLSLGGVVARLAAEETVRWPRLNIRRLFTIASPHTGAELAPRFRFLSPVLDDISPGSTFLAELNARTAVHDYEFVPYAIRNDGIVGYENQAPPGENAYWVRGRLFGSHLAVNMDDTILTDIALRLRGEPSLFKGPPQSAAADAQEPSR